MSSAAAIRGRTERANSRPRGASNWRRVFLLGFRRLRGYLAGPAAVALITTGAFHLHLNLSTSGSFYFLVVVMVAMTWGFWEASVTSLIAVNCLNYFFVPPVLTWRVIDPENWIALATFEITALTVSRLSARVKGQARAETRQRVQVEKLYELSRRILLLDRSRTIAPQMVALIQEIFRTESVALFDARPARLDADGPQSAALEQIARNAYLRDAASAGLDGQTWSEVLRLGSKPIGGIALRGPELDRLTVAAVASLTAIALERARSFEKESRAEAARQTEQLRTAVLDALAHAFKTPLTAIHTASSGLLEGGRLAPGDAELAGLIDEQTGHLNRLTSELLQMARLDAARIKLQRERISVLTLIEDVLARHREQLHGRRVEIADSSSGLEVYGDRELLVTALGQFLDNASKYSTPGSPIVLAAEENLGEIVVAVHNEGPPIGAADRERIFERFYRTEQTRHRAPGTGLGLSIARKAAEAHGGRTWVVSEEAHGTTFYLALPPAPKKPYDAVPRQCSDR